MRYPAIALLFTACTACASHAKPPSDSIYPDVIEHRVPEDISQFKQPATLIADLKKIQSGNLDERVKALVEKSKRDQVFVKGGTFMMGDFGKLQSEENLPWDGDSDSSPLHEVTLDSYSISRYKVTIAEFDVYAEANKVASVQTEDVYTQPIADRPVWRTPDKPAGTTWLQAKAYCQWIAKVSGKPFDLPTEAQWEYAARDRGRFIVYPTDNGKLEWNKNVPSHDFIKLMNGGRGSSPFAIAYFPPNPLGLYDLTLNSLDWMQDWYAADYYERVEKKRNPAGPETGEERSQRSWPASDDRVAMTMSRRSGLPTPATNKMQYTAMDGFRCVVQTPKPVSED